VALRRARRASGAPPAPQDRPRGVGTRRLAFGGVALASGAMAAGAAAIGVPGAFRTLLNLTRVTPPDSAASTAPPPAGLPVAPAQPTPVPMVPTQPPLALVLVLDRSGSMSATDTGPTRPSRMALAIEGARRALAAVSFGDLLGVISFDYDARWVVDVKRLSGAADFQDADQRLGAIQPDGGTDIYRALELAYRGLQQVSAAAKHIILLTDGEQGTPAPFPTLVAALQRSGVSVSTVGIGSRGGAAQTLEHIARLGQGRFHMVHSAEDLPDVLEDEASTFVSLVRPRTPVLT
jgi:hypothetical protein